MTVQYKKITEQEIALADDLRWLACDIAMGAADPTGNIRRRFADAFNAIRNAEECTAGAVTE